MSRRRILAAAVVMAAATVGAAAQTAAPAPTAAERDSLARAVASYVGPSVARTLEQLSTLDATVDTDTFLETFTAIVRGGEAPMDAQQADAYIDRYVRARRPVIPDTLSLETQRAYVDAAATQPGAQLLASGAVLITERAGSGEFPADTSDVTLSYVGKFYNGFEFDSTDEPIEMTVGELVEGFSEGLRHMQPGGRYRLVIPATAAYGPRGIPGAIPGNAALDFTIDLIAVKPETSTQE